MRWRASHVRFLLTLFTPRLLLGVVPAALGCSATGTVGVVQGADAGAGADADAGADAGANLACPLGRTKGTEWVVDVPPTTAATSDNPFPAVFPRAPAIDRQGRIFLSLEGEGSAFSFSGTESPAPLPGAPSLGPVSSMPVALDATGAAILASPNQVLAPPDPSSSVSQLRFDRPAPDEAGGAWFLASFSGSVLFNGTSSPLTTTTQRMALLHVTASGNVNRFQAWDPSLTGGYGVAYDATGQEVAIVGGANAAPLLGNLTGSFLSVFSATDLAHPRWFADVAPYERPTEPAFYGHAVFIAGPGSHQLAIPLASGPTLWLREDDRGLSSNVSTWTATSGGEWELNDVHVDDAGNRYLAGNAVGPGGDFGDGMVLQTGSSVSPTTPVVGFVVSFDGSNALRWVRFFQTSDPSQFCYTDAMSAAPDGRVYALLECPSGVTLDVAGTTVASVGRGTLLALDATGHLLWSRLIHQDIHEEVAADPCVDAVVVTTRNRYDAWIARFVGP